MATPLRPIECSAQPLCISFHPSRDVVAAGLVDGTVEIHDLIAEGVVDDAENAVDATSAKAKAKSKERDDDDDDDIMEGDDDDDEGEGRDTILSSTYVAREAPPSKSDTRMLARSDSPSAATGGRATQGPSCRRVLFSRSSGGEGGGGGERLFTACNGGSLRCLDSDLACSLDRLRNPDASSSSPIVWSVENAHGAGISALHQLPHSSPCGPALVTGDDVGTVRLWDARTCGNGGGDGNDKKSNAPFDGLMRPPRGCVQHWKVNRDYITDFETDGDGSTLFASSADGTLSVFDVRFAGRRGTPRSVVLPCVDPHEAQQQKAKRSTWEASGYARSDNQEDELLSLSLIKHSKKLLVGTQDGMLSLFSHGQWGDMSDRFPGHPASIDALLKIDEDTVLTGSSDGLVRAVQLLPNALLGVLGGHDGFPVEGLGWSAGRRYVGSVSHDEYVRLWDASFLNEDGEGDDDDEEEGGKMTEDAPGSRKGSGGASTKARADDGEDEDDWEDMDEDADDDMDGDSEDSDDSDDDGGGGSGKPKKREKIFKTESEAFFSDL